MAKTLGLSEEQLNILNSAHVGDLVLAIFPKHHPESLVYLDLWRLIQETDPLIVGFRADDWNDPEDTSSDTITSSEFDQEGDPESDSDESADSEFPYYPHAAPLYHFLYYVQAIERTERGAIRDIKVCTLNYNSFPYNPPAYQIFGDKVVYDAGKLADGGEYAGSWLSDIKKPEDITFTLRPTGDYIIRSAYRGRCPGRCVDGWLDDESELARVMDRVFEHVRPYKPVCAVCLGEPLALTQHQLRVISERTHLIDLTPVIEFSSWLNVARRQLGYTFKQFDEREWGHHFDDMIYQNENEDANASQFENWEEATNPQNYIKLRPAAASAIAALPRKPFWETAQARKDPEVGCLVCRENITLDTTVVELPCSHVFCDSGCIAQWLTQFNNCPACRARVPAADGSEREKN